jgi:hypothetical protein
MEVKEEYRGKIIYQDEDMKNTWQCGLCLSLPIWGKMYPGGGHDKGEAGRED